MTQFLKRFIWSLGFLLLSSVSAEARDYYGAIAYSPSTHLYGYSYDHEYRSAAEDAAMNYCGQGDCSVAIWFRNACGALAIGSSGYGSGWGSNRSRAEAEALNSCRGYSDNCQIQQWVCTTR